MQRDRAAALSVRDLDPESKQITQLTLEGGEVGVNRTSRAATAGWGLCRLVGTNQMLDLTHRQPITHNLRGNSRCVG